MQSGQCVRITTGAAVPAGADSVVQVEDTHLVHASADNTEELEINIMKIPKVGEDIRLSENSSLLNNSSQYFTRHKY